MRSRRSPVSTSSPTPFSPRGTATSSGASCATSARSASWRRSSHRWQIVRLLDQGLPYLEIAERVHTSTATVTRVAQWLRHGAGGYTLALERTHARRRHA